MSNYTTLNILPCAEADLNSKKPLTIIIDLNTYPMGTGTKEIKIKINENEFIFSKDEIETLLILAKNKIDEKKE